MKSHKSIIGLAPICIFLLLFLSSCNDPNKWKKVDVSKVNVPMQVYRFDQDFFSYDTLHTAESDERLRARYGQFFDDYITAVMGFGAAPSRVDTTSRDPHIDILNYFRLSADRELYDAVQKQYKDFNPIAANIKDALKHFQFYFSDKPPVTKVYTIISPLANGAFTYGDSAVGIGLDMYLGPDCKYYDGPGLDYPRYMRRRFVASSITPNVMEVMYQLYFDQPEQNAALPMIEGMINEGKKFYYLECMMPDAPDSLLIGYNSAQEQWCRNSEKSIWQYFNTNDLLYKVNFMDQKRYTADGPSTTGMPPEAPGRVGAWLGWQIVRRFMRNADGKVSLNDLLTKYTAKEIFAKANYKPK